METGSNPGSIPNIEYLYVQDIFCGKIVDFTSGRLSIIRSILVIFKKGNQYPTLATVLMG